eukprot:1162134-Pelagomonas_calceolata.AAC.12
MLGACEVTAMQCWCIPGGVRGEALPREEAQGPCHFDREPISIYLGNHEYMQVHPHLGNVGRVLAGQLADLIEELLHHWIYAVFCDLHKTLTVRRMPEEGCHVL